MRRVCLGQVLGAHGVRGAVRIRPFTAEPADVGAYGPVGDQDGSRSWTVQVLHLAKGMAVARLSGVDDRDAAETLRGLRLYVDRDALPASDDPEEFYHADLVGLRVEDPAGSTIGEVVAVHDFGAGDVLEVRRPELAPVMLPFTREVVPSVDLAGGRLVALPPAGLLPETTGKGAPPQPPAPQAAEAPHG